MHRLFGIETEYGITREDLETIDPVVESMELVRAHNRPYRSDWDYGAEDPKRDARGFRAKTLQQEKEEEEFERLDRRRPFSFQEMKSDLMLGNGARFYNDHTHPEYSTPECAGLKDLVAHDRAGERILLACAERRNRMLGKPDAVQLYKNNTDFHGHSYGCHDNYLLPRSLPFNDLVICLLPFLVSRQIVTGAGKIGIENGSGYRTGTYQISQRADFIEVEVSIDTMHERPIINTRDEPHADPDLYRRLHLILGDANMS
ncbi:MAG TPA: proteasome accessory factor PafA2 family protein, partial [Nitrospiria bacterium]|nr:proteasome accessory factor PafA2 family protein [Nitrospiria bacterium]